MATFSFVMKRLHVIAIVLLFPAIAAAQSKPAQQAPLPRDTPVNPAPSSGASSSNADAGGLLADVARVYEQLEATVAAEYAKFIAAKKARLDAVRARLNEIAPTNGAAPSREFVRLTEEAKRLEKEIAALEKKRDEQLANIAKAKAKALAEARKFLDELAKIDPSQREQTLDDFRRATNDSVAALSKSLQAQLPKPPDTTTPAPTRRSNTTRESRTRSLANVVSRGRL